MSLHRCILSLVVPFMTLALGIRPAMTTAAETNGRVTYAIAIHGGAGPWANRSAEETAEIRAAIEQTLRHGRDLLAGGGTSLDAVEQTIRALEDSPLFNAGKGATFTAAGTHQLDASIMRGKDRAAGAVAAVSIVKNPISLARRVMTDTKHVLLTGDGAHEFAREIGAELVSPDYFWTDKTRAEWKEVQIPPAEQRQSRALPTLAESDHFGTVGCVALDTHGNLAAGTSTGGLKMKRYGRVGDSPIVGAGTYADNQTCAVSGTGVGELFIRNAVAYDIAARIRYQQASLQQAVQVQVDVRLPAETAGLIALSPQGEFVAAFNTSAMPRGLADSSGRFEIHIER